MKILHLFLLAASHLLQANAVELSKERVFIQTSYGDIEMAFYPTIAPITVPHILKLFKLGCYNSNHFFRVDKGFVAQTSDVINGRQVPLSAEQMKEAEVKVPLEVTDTVKHKAGTLSMARHSDPNSGGSSFSILLGAASHLDGQYTIFGEVVNGMETLRKMEELPTKKEGIFVMPLERVTIYSTYVTHEASQDPLTTTSISQSTDNMRETGSFEQECEEAKLRVKSLEVLLQATREKCLPGNTG